MIPNLSRIRITAEDINCLNNELDFNYFQQRFEDMSHTTSDNISEHKSIVTTDQSSVDQNWFKDYFFDSTPKSLSKNSQINEKTATETSDSVDLNNDWKVVTKRGSFVAKEKEKPINYLDLPDIKFSPTVFFYTVVVYNENKPLVGIRYHNDVYKPLILLLEFLSKNKNLKDMSKTSRWKSISKQLIGTGFDGNDWSPTRTRKHFLEALNLYEKVWVFIFEDMVLINYLFSVSLIVRIT